MSTPSAVQHVSPHVAGAAFRAILQNIQALDLSFATKAVETFRSAAGEGQLDYDKTSQALSSLQLEGFLGQTAEAEGVGLGSGAEYRRLWKLWRTESHTVDEQCFLFLAWRGHRFSEASFIQEIALPLFQIMDGNNDQLVSAEELDAALESEDPAKQLTPEARSDIGKLKSELRELLVYHTDSVGSDGSTGVDFPGFLALICDAQDKWAMRRYTSKGPVECMARYHNGVVFLRPANLAECAQPQEQEELEALMTTAPALDALKEARASAEAALQEARTAKAAAEEARQAVAELSSQQGRPKAATWDLTSTTSAPSSELDPPKAVTAAPAATAAAAETSKPPVKAATPAPKVAPAPFQAGAIEEAPVMDVGAMATFAPPERTTKRVVAVKRTQDVHCKACQELISVDSNFCRFCGEQQKAERRNSALKLPTKEASRGSAHPVEPKTYIPKFPKPCVDASTDHLVESVARSPVNSRLVDAEEESVEEVQVVREAFCIFCGTEFMGEQANYCSNCGHRRGGGKRRSQETPHPAFNVLPAAPETHTVSRPVAAQETHTAARPVVAQATQPLTVKRAVATGSPTSDATTATMQSPFDEDDTPTAPAEEDRDLGGDPVAALRSEISLDTLDAVALHNKEHRELAAKVQSHNRQGNQPVQGEVPKAPSEGRKDKAVATEALEVASPPVVVSSPPVSTAPVSTLTNPSPNMPAELKTAQSTELEDEYYWEEEESEEEEAFEDDPVVDPGPQNPSQAKLKARS